MTTYSWPLVPPLIVTDEFGPRESPGGIGSTNHRGIDFAASTGDPVYAPQSGRVTWAGYNGGEGLSVHIQSDDTGLTKCFHNSRLLVSTGDWISESDLIAFAGTTGASTGPHVHFETWGGGVVQNPRVFMREHGAGTPETPLRYPGSGSASRPTPIPEQDDSDMPLFIRQATPSEPGYGDTFIVTGDGPLRHVMPDEWSAWSASRAVGGQEARSVAWNNQTIDAMIARVGLFGTVGPNDPKGRLTGSVDYSQVIYRR